MSDASQQSDLTPRAAAEPWVSEPEYRQGVVDLLGVLAYGALAAFDRLAEDARRLKVGMGAGPTRVGGKVGPERGAGSDQSSR